MYAIRSYYDEPHSFYPKNAVGNNHKQECLDGANDKEYEDSGKQVAGFTQMEESYNFV